MTTEQPGETREAGTETPAACAVSLYLRASPTTVGRRRQEEVRERLSALAEAGTIGSLDVERWSGRITVGADERPAMATLYDELTGVAEAADARLEPFFAARSGVDGIVGDASGDRVITFPVIAAVVELGGEIVGLYPCHRGGIHHRVEACVETLEDGRVPANLRR